jgi:lipopolysaccharide transport system ATP-binding protein
MTEAIITVEGLGKKYRISHQRQNGMRYKSLRDVIAEKAKRLFTRNQKSEITSKTSDLRPPASSSASLEDFWALRDVSFEVKQGEVVGIIGRNGAGKSTLLKILSRITEPTEGEVRIRGRVASLLEVGTGFHPELTGRENVFLNGAILGMTRVEIKRKFDEIVAFAEVEKFLDTPVKRYSSGMYVRLAFAVAAHLDPEILIVDEVLAVGDSEFQKKCLGKMQSVATQEGRTVLFVSHNLKSIEQLCQRGLLLKHGHVGYDNIVKNTITEYIRSAENIGATANGVELLNDLRLSHFALSPAVFQSKSTITFVITLEACSPQLITNLEMLIYNELNERMSLIDLRKAGAVYRLDGARILMIDGTIPRFNLVEGQYFVGLFIRTSHGAREFLNLLRIHVLPPPIAIGISPIQTQWMGSVLLDCDFTVHESQ